jgi:hypothetical protein
LFCRNSKWSKLYSSFPILYFDRKSQILYFFPFKVFLLFCRNSKWSKLYSSFPILYFDRKIQILYFFPFKVFLLFCRNSKWSKSRTTLKIHTILAPSAHGVGDVLRELDAKSLIQTDFILVSGTCVANMKLDKVLEQHRFVMTQIALYTDFQKSPHVQQRCDHDDGNETSFAKKSNTVSLQKSY